MSNKTEIYRVQTVLNRNKNEDLVGYIEKRMEEESLSQVQVARELMYFGLVKIMEMNEEGYQREVGKLHRKLIA